MDKREAKAILAGQLNEYRRRSHVELQALIESQETLEVTGELGTCYQLEFLAVWDSKPNGNLRVFGHIDDGGVRAFFPLSDDFIIAPDGSFVGEDSRAI